MNEGWELKHTMELLFYDSYIADLEILYEVLLWAIVLVQCFFIASPSRRSLNILIFVQPHKLLCSIIGIQPLAWGCFRGI